MNKMRTIQAGLAIAFMSVAFTSCAPKSIIDKTEDTSVPSNFINPQDSAFDSTDTLNSAKVSWREYFTDPHLNALIDTALIHNQELNISLQDIRIFNNEVLARRGEYMPFLNFRGGAGLDKPGLYTPAGAVEENLQYEPGRDNPSPMPDYNFGVYADWEIDIWHKLHDAKDAAVAEYLASVEGNNFLVTNLIAEIANSYYELLALDNELEIVKQNIEIQSNALRIMKIQKQAAKVTELAVRKFEAEVYHTRSLQYGIEQEIVVTENKINFLLGRFPQHIERDATVFGDLVPDTIHAGIPAQLLENRPDVRKAELELVAAKLDVSVARKNFYPTLNISAGVGYQAFNPAYLVQTPQSMLYGLLGDIAGPILNRRALTAAYYTASARQVQAIYEYEQTILNAYIEVSNQLSNIQNLDSSLELKTQEVDALNNSIDISYDLFKSARADYMEILLTQRDALNSKFELIETKKQRMNAMVNIYRALGGGWN